LCRHAKLKFKKGGSYDASSLVQSVAGDVLRLAASSFVEDDVSVKLQALGLAVKLSLSRPHDNNVQLVSDDS